MANDKKSYKIVGEINKELAQTAEFEYYGEVYMSPGVIKHIMKKHKNNLEDYVTNNIIDYIKLIIRKPDFVGKHPKKVGTSIELVKKIEQNLLLAIDVDLDEHYIYVASLYPITEAKLISRISSGRVKKFKK
ncbi:hypothetical protein SAMN02745163_00428 [Clostridium cavendishii DSM 21758]|uniref:Phage-Barnase-EndoU-ColicinE5/D-RelE like nuclease 3 domain-containing protein n=1 Tax=Clostridium cavendishii DSM 21758 TaxID=1121302 RepID=A0A1M6CC62_9CLOT|nr:hypothetical protein [Clostridium cavendishii]SHI58463.1 hypothetical protein SAMN02745163_00428 [Clostridium cavendishii DSM 21758]